MEAGGLEHDMATVKVKEEIEESADQSQEIDSKYRLIILAAKRSKQLQRGARARIDIDSTKHKPTRIALEEVVQGKVRFHTTHEEEDPALKA